MAAAEADRVVAAGSQGPATAALTPTIGSLQVDKVGVQSVRLQAVPDGLEIWKTATETGKAEPVETLVETLQFSALTSFDEQQGSGGAAELRVVAEGRQAITFICAGAGKVCQALSDKQASEGKEPAEMQTTQRVQLEVTSAGVEMSEKQQEKQQLVHTYTFANLKGRWSVDGEGITLEESVQLAAKVDGEIQTIQRVRPVTFICRDLRTAKEKAAAVVADIDALCHALDEQAEKRSKHLAAQQANVMRVLRQAVKDGRSLFGIKLTSVAKVFQAIDRDESGFIDTGEMSNALQRLGLGLTINQVSELFSGIDDDGSDEIDWKEFYLAYEADQQRIADKKARAEARRQQQAAGMKMAKTSAKDAQLERMEGSSIRKRTGGGWQIDRPAGKTRWLQMLADMPSLLGRSVQSSSLGAVGTMVRSGCSGVSPSGGLAAGGYMPPTGGYTSGGEYTQLPHSGLVAVQSNGSIVRLPISFAERRGQVRRKRMGLHRGRHTAKSQRGSLERQANLKPGSGRSLSLKAAANATTPSAPQKPSTRWGEHLKANKGGFKLVQSRLRPRACATSAAATTASAQLGTADGSGAASINSGEVMRAKKELRQRLRQALKSRAVVDWAGAFDAMDTDGDEMLSLAEVSTALEALSVALPTNSATGLPFSVRDILGPPPSPPLSEDAMKDARKVAQLKRDAAAMMANNDHASAADTYRQASALSNTEEATILTTLAEYADASSKQWVYLDDAGAQQGPYTLEVLHQWYNAGYLQHERQVGILPTLRADEIEYRALGKIDAIVDPPTITPADDSTAEPAANGTPPPSTAVVIGRQQLVDWLATNQKGYEAAAFPKSRLLDLDWTVALQQAAPVESAAPGPADDQTMIKKKDFVSWLSARFDGDKMTGDIISDAETKEPWRYVSNSGEGFGDPPALKDPEISEATPQVQAFERMKADEAAAGGTLDKMYHQLRDVVKETESEKTSHGTAVGLTEKLQTKQREAAERRDVSHSAALHKLQKNRGKLLASILRLELGEIETVATEVAGATEAVAVVQEDRAANKRIVLFVPPQNADAIKMVRMCSSWIREPRYMVPAELMVIETWPRSGSGMIDRSQLSVAGYGAKLHSVPFETPTNDLDERLSESSKKSQLQTYLSAEGSLDRQQRQFRKNVKEIETAKSCHEASLEAEKIVQSSQLEAASKADSAHAEAVRKLELKQSKLRDAIAVKKEKLQVDATARRQRLNALFAAHSPRGHAGGARSKRPAGQHTFADEKPPWRHASVYAGIV